MNNKFIFVDYHKCVGCGTCEMVCSLVHEGICSSALSRIRIVRFEKIGRHVPISCASCEKPACISVCPAGAIIRSGEDGIVTIQEDKCIGCRQCIQACPFGHMNFSISRGVAYKCDLCGGDPQCVKFCWTNAIEFLPADMAVAMRRQAAAQSIMKES